MLKTLKAPNTTKADFANTVDPDKTAHNEPSHQDPQCLPSSILIYNIIQFELKVFENFADIILSSAFLALYGLRHQLVICQLHHQIPLFFVAKKAMQCIGFSHFPTKYSSVFVFETLRKC